jgi:hypothetical protein
MRTNLLAAMCILGFAAPLALAQPVSAPVASAPGESTPQGVLRALSRESADAGAIRDAALTNFDRVIASTSAGKPEAYRDAAIAARLSRQLADLDASARARIASFLAESPELAVQLAMLVREDVSKPAPVYATLARLLPGREGALRDHPALAAAVCVVHDHPYTLKLNENIAKAPGAGEVFDYFVAHEREMLLPLRSMPAELLVYVVSVAAPISDLDWLRATYAGQADLGRRYSEIHYDKDSFLRGTAKKSTAAGYSLHSIKDNGGVCIDQAYFAQSCGQAQGIPSVIVYGTNASVAHAWIGFLKSSAASATWDFDSGRYESYQNVRGTVEDPQTGARIPDAYLSVLESYMMAKPEVRQESAALVDAAERLLRIRDAKQAWPPEGAEKGGIAGANADGALTLVEAALRTTPGYTRGWLLVRKLAEKGEMSAAQKKRWADVLFMLCGNKYPDFTLEILRPMIRSVQDAGERRALWERAAGIYAKRPDLIVRIRMEEASTLAEAKDDAGAYELLHEAGARYISECHEAVQALGAAAGVLKKAGKESAIAPMLGDVARGLRKPQTTNPVFVRGSAWFSVNLMYAEALERAGKAEEAQRVRASLGLDESKSSKPIPKLKH